MALGTFSFRTTTRALCKGNKAQTTDNRSLSQNHTKSPSGLLAKAKMKFNHRYLKTAIALQLQADAKPSAIIDNNSGFAIPPLQFSAANLSEATTKSFDTLQHMIATGLTPVDRTDSIDVTGSNTPTVESSVPRPEYRCAASVATRVDEVGEVSSAGIASSSETALSVHAVTAVSLQNLSKHTALEAKPATEEDSQHFSPPMPSLGAQVVHSGSDIPAANLTNSHETIIEKEPKAKQQKLANILHRLKAKLWPWNNNKGPSIELEANQKGEDEDCSDRCQWDIITKIKYSTIIEILRSTLGTVGYNGTEPMEVISKAQGSFHLVFKVKAIRNTRKMNLDGWVVKIPGHGTPDRWTAEDEHMLVQEVETMRLINLHTEVPSPWVVDYSATLDNKFGFPYIVMKELPGKSATDLWFENHCEVPSPETEKKRLTFLRSLAHHMTELEKLQFHQIGIPKCKITGEEYYEIYEEIEGKRLPVDKYYVWPYYDTYASVERGPFPSTQAYVRHARDEDELIPLDPTTKLTEDHVQEYGTSALLDIIFSHPVFHSAPDATFTLRHSDLDTQNLLIDATGAITGILDWDASLAMPRCVGHASVPHFLDRDFHRDSIIRSPFLCWRAPHYRAVYAAALREAGNPDAAYTAKSHMYQAAFAALYEGGDVQDFVERILGEVPGLRVEVHDIKFLLAKGCTATREMLVRELGKVLDPELPPVGFLEGVEEQIRDAVVKGWMDGFEHFFETGVEEM